MEFFCRIYALILFHTLHSFYNLYNSETGEYNELIFTNNAICNIRYRKIDDIFFTQKISCMSYWKRARLFFILYTND